VRERLRTHSPCDEFLKTYAWNTQRSTPRILGGRHVFDNPHKPVRILVRQWSEEHRVHHAEDGGVRADPERQRENRRERECGILVELSKSVAEILAECVDEWQATLIAINFFHVLDATEVATRSDLGVLRRPSNVWQKRVRRVIYGVIAVAIVGLITLGLSRLKPAAPSVERATVWIDTVKRGPLLRDVRGLGTLVPEDIRWIPATTQGRVDRILLHPGTSVKADSVLLELVNPQLDQEYQDAGLKVQAAEASLQNLRVQAHNDYLQQQATAASISADYYKAKMQAEMNEALGKEQLVSALTLRQSQVDVEQLAIRDEIAKQQLASYEDSIKARLAVQQSEVDQARAVMTLRGRQRDELKVRAGLDGMLQVVPVEVGQQVAPGTNLARVANPNRLKAQVKIAETQAKDIQIGQKAHIDTRNGIVDGLVARIDPSVQNGTITVDVALTGDLPRGAVPDLSVDGTVELERMADVLYVGRPAFGQEQSTVGLFKLQADGGATRAQVKLGRSSVNAVEIVSGLNVGDQVVLSDMSAWDAFDRVRLQ
jgi:HlyD family secretion protein